MRRQIAGVCFGAALGLAAPLVADETMGPEVVLVGLAGQDAFGQVAYNETHDQYVAVWASWDPGVTPAQSILARRFDRNGRPVGGAVVVGPGGDFHDRAWPVIAYDPTADGFLIVYGYDYWGDGSDWDIRGRFVDWNLGGASGEITVADSADGEWIPQVAFSPASETYLVVWSQPTSAGERVEGVLITSGTVGTRFIVASHPSETRWPQRVAHDAATDAFVVVSASNHDIFATRVETSGALGPVVPVADWPDTEQWADVASCGTDQFAVVWASATGGGDYDIYIRFLYGDGTIATPPILIDGSPAEEDLPHIACRGGSDEYLVVYRRAAGLRGRRISTSRALRPGYELVQDSGVAGFVGVGGGDAGWLAFWNVWDAATSWDIHARVTWSLFADDFEWGDTGQWSAVVP